MLRKLCLAAAGLACCAGAAFGQGPTLYLFKWEPLNFITTTATDPLYIGNNISAVSLLNGDLYVGGFNNGGGSTGARTVGIARINNTYGTQGQLASRVTLIADYGIEGSGRFISGMDTYRREISPGVFEARLAAGFETNATSAGASNFEKWTVWDIETPSPTSPIATTSALDLSTRATGGAAWDFGTTGLGIAFPTNASDRRPIAAFLQNGARGPRGFDVTPGLVMDPADPNAYGDGLPNDTDGPRLAANGESGTFYRDIWIHRGNGIMVGRMENQIIVVDRNFDRYVAGGETPPAPPTPRPPSTLSTPTIGTSDYNYWTFWHFDTSGQALDVNGNVASVSGQPQSNPVPYNTVANRVTTPKYGFIPNTTQGVRINTATQAAQQNVAITEGLATEWLVWNDRTSTGLGQSFGAVVKANRLSDGSAGVIDWRGIDGASISTFPYTFGNLTIANGAGNYDFAWDRDLQVLAISDAPNKAVYFFSATQPGSCALPAGGCLLLPANVCTSAKVGGTAGAPGSTCPVIACCNSTTGGCTLVAQQFCSGSIGVGATCSPNPCPQPGACCNPAQACTATLSNACAAGSVFIPGGTCGVNPCQPTGSCCTAGSCSVTFQADCSGAGQAWTNAGTCDPDPCAPATGQCCVAGACSVTTQAACTGSWTAGGACSPNPCPQPSVVCCRGSTCSIVATAGDCTVPGSPVVGAVVSTAAACGVNNAPTPATGCCFADFNKIGGVTIDDIFIYLNAWFATSEFANVGTPGTPNIDDIFIFLNAWFAGCN